MLIHFPCIFAVPHEEFDRRKPHIRGVVPPLGNGKQGNFSLLSNEFHYKMAVMISCPRPFMDIAVTLGGLELCNKVASLYRDHSKDELNSGTLTVNHRGD